MTEERHISRLYLVIRWFVRLFSPKFKLRQTENLPDEPCIIVGNHSQMYGPIAAELYAPSPHDTWCTADMMTKGQVADYAFRDFWSQKPASVRWFFKLLSRVIEPLAILIFTNANTIPVYRDAKVYKTFRQSMEALEAGRNIVIYPECYTEHNNIVHEFQDHFTDLAKLWYRRTGKRLAFVPMYVAPTLGTMTFGEPFRYDPDSPLDQERQRICGGLMDRITALAAGMPEHTVVPYPNISRRLYPKNLPVVSAPARPADEPLKLTPAGITRVPGSPDPALEPRLIPSKAQLYDYRGFSLKRLGDPRFSHVLLLGGWLVYFALYFLTENLIPLDSCHPIHCTLDDLIPFCEYFLIFYGGWYLLVVASLARTLFTDADRFRRLQTFIIITQLVAMAIYILYPSRQDLRPATFERQNLFTWVLGLIYAFDTPTGVLPSLHVGYSLGILSVGLKDRTLPKGWKGFLVFVVAGICASVCFVKQHSVLDVLAALPLALLAEALVYGKDFWLPKLWHHRELQAE